jgi:hypothetical protein
LYLVPHALANDLLTNPCDTLQVVPEIRDAKYAKFPTPMDTHCALAAM